MTCEDNTFYIRADGNAAIGTGHIMRCLSIAQAMRERGWSCTFIVADTAMVYLLEKQMFPYVCLHSVWNDLDQETVQMEELIEQRHIRLLLIDSYFVTHDYLGRLSQLTHVAYMDDLNCFVYPCSTLINYNIYANQWNYPERYPGVQCLLGPQYVPLRSEFQKLPRRCLKGTIRDVLVSTGGSDLLNIAGQFTKCAIHQFPEVTFHIIVGRFNPHEEMLKRLSYICPRVKLHSNVQHMSKLMLCCDAAVSAGGSTLYELCACGTPTVTYTLADNQLSGTVAFERRGMMLYAGDVREHSTFAEAMCDKLAVLIGDFSFQKHMSERMQRSVDGGGAERLARCFGKIEEL